MKVELLELEREYLVTTLKYQVEVLRDCLCPQDHPKDLVAWGHELVRLGELLEKFKKTYEPVPNFGQKSTKKKGK